MFQRLTGVSGYNDVCQGRNVVLKLSNSCKYHSIQYRNSCGKSMFLQWKQ